MSFEASIVRFAYQRGYRVSEDGQLISSTGKTLSTSPNRSGYLNARIRVDRIAGKRRTTALLVHQLAAYQKYGEIALTQETRHRDGNPRNNRRDNILIGTRSDNELDKPPEVRRAVALKATEHVTKWDQDAESIRADRRAGYSYRELCRKYDIAKSSLHFLLNDAQY